MRQQRPRQHKYHITPHYNTPHRTTSLYITPHHITPHTTLPFIPLHTIQQHVHLTPSYHIIIHETIRNLGIYNGEYCIVTDALMNDYRNSGGFDMIGSGRHKIEKPKEFADAMANCTALDLDG